MLDGLVELLPARCFQAPYRNDYDGRKAVAAYLELVNVGGLSHDDAIDLLKGVGTDAMAPSMRWFSTLRSRLPADLDAEQSRAFEGVIEKAKELTGRPREEQGAQSALWDSRRIFDGTDAEGALRRANFVCDLVDSVPLERMGGYWAPQVKINPTLLSLTGAEIDHALDSKLPPLIEILGRQLLSSEGYAALTRRYLDAHSRDSKVELLMGLWCVLYAPESEQGPMTALIERLLCAAPSDQVARRYLTFAVSMLPERPDNASALLWFLEERPDDPLRSYFVEYYSELLPELKTAPRERLEQLTTSIGVFTSLFVRYDASQPFVREIQEQLKRAFSSVLKGTWKRDRYIDAQGNSRLPFLSREAANAWMEDDVTHLDLSSELLATARSVKTPETLEALKSHSGLPKLRWDLETLQALDALIEQAEQAAPGTDESPLGWIQPDPSAAKDLGAGPGTLRQVRAMIALVVAEPSAVPAAVLEADALASRLLPKDTRRTWRRLVKDVNALVATEVRDEDSPDAVLGSNKQACQSAGGKNVHGLAVQLCDPTVKRDPRPPLR